MSGCDVRYGQEMVCSKVNKGFGRCLFYGLLFILFSVMMYGCRGTPVWLRSDPAEVVRGYLQAVESQDEEAVWEFLSQETRNQLEQKAGEYNRKHAAVQSRHGREMLRFGHVMSSTREYKKIVVATKDANHAVVNIVLHDESALSVDLFRESDRWAIGLPLDKMDIK